MDLPTLENSLDRWEFWLVVATALVVLGLILEYWHEVRDLIRERPLSWRSVQKIIGAVLVTVGVAGELFIQSRASHIETDLRTANHLTEASLRLEANDALLRASTADLARIQLEKSMEWRHLSQKQKIALCSIVTPRIANEMMTLSSPQDPEAWSFANDFASELRQCAIDGGFDPHGRLGTQSWSSDVMFGVWIKYSKAPNPAIDLRKREAMARSLRKSLEDNGITIAGITTGEPAAILAPFIYVGPRLRPNAAEIANKPNTTP